ncbi:hypothetical protein OF83DRAFT_1113778 [Amylostereum chailletii]|nr:hypothetical protein OF83DRAFT_1113778 [Amylostereum chailletii]
MWPREVMRFGGGLSILMHALGDPWTVRRRGVERDEDVSRRCPGGGRVRVQPWGEQPSHHRDGSVTDRSMHRHELTSSCLCILLSQHTTSKI